MFSPFILKNIPKQLKNLHKNNKSNRFYLDWRFLMEKVVLRIKNWFLAWFKETQEIKENGTWYFMKICKITIFLKDTWFFFKKMSLLSIFIYFSYPVIGLPLQKCWLPVHLDTMQTSVLKVWYCFKLLCFWCLDAYQNSNLI